MNRRLRAPIRSPHLRAMAWLAWLMLVLTPLHAAPSAVAGPLPAGAGASHSMATPAMPMHAMHAMTTMGHARAQIPGCCCHGQGHDDCGSIGACHCAGGGSALPLAAMPELAPPMLGAVYASARRLAPPGRIHAPPLRPPTV